jgi:transcriptional regulator with XRE-family HTH domain
MKTKDMNTLQKQLKEKLEERKMTVTALEKSAGLKRSAVHNILRGRSKKPSAEILHAIARILNCTIDELLDVNTVASSNSQSDTRSHLPINSRLYAEAAKIADKIFSDKKMAPSQSLALSFIEEIYLYTLQSGLQNIDLKFSIWLADKWFKK